MILRVLPRPAAAVPGNVLEMGFLRLRPESIKSETLGAGPSGCEEVGEKAGDEGRGHSRINLEGESCLYIVFLKINC